MPVRRAASSVLVSNLSSGLAIVGSFNLERSVGRWSSNPVIRDPRDWTPKHDIGDKGEQNRNPRRLRRIERLEHHPLVDGVHDHAKDDDPRRRDEALPQTPAAALGVANAMDQGPDIRPAPDARVMYAIAQRGDNRHRRLQDEAECHRAPRPVQDVAPQTPKTLCGKAIPERAADDEDDQEPDRQARLNDLRFGWRLGQREAGPRTTHRNPTWLVEVSTGSACRAAGR